MGPHKRAAVGKQLGDTTPLTLLLEEGAASQGKQAAPWSWNRQEVGLFPEPPGGTSLADTLTLGLLTSTTVG